MNESFTVISNNELNLFNDIPAPIFVLAPSNDGRPIYCALNEAALNITQFTPPDYLGKTAAELFYGEFGKNIYQKHLEVLHTGEPSVYELSIPIGGKLHDIETHLKPVLDAHGKVARIIGTTCFLAQLFERLGIRNHQQISESEFQAFIHLAAHDLRSPLLKINAFAEMLQENFKDQGDGKLHIIDMLKQVSAESQTTLTGILNHASMVGEEESLELLSLASICRSIFVILDPENRHKLVIKDCTISCERVLLQVILRNLIDNAFKHNTSQAITVKITATNAVAGFFSIVIADNGRGLANPECLFLQTESDRSKSGYGVLAICKLIRSRGGDIHASNTSEETGLLVTATIPGAVRVH